MLNESEQEDYTHPFLANDLLHLASRYTYLQQQQQHQKYALIIKSWKLPKKKP